MSRAQRKKGNTRVVRNEAVRRHVVDRVPLGVLASEHGVSLVNMKSWVDHWHRRVGSWCRLTELEPWAVAFGLVIGGSGYVTRTDGSSPFSYTPLMRFVDRLAMVPGVDRNEPLEAYAALDAGDRDRLGPALDVYLQASDLMDQVRELVKRASAIAAGEVLDVARAA